MHDQILTQELIGAILRDQGIALNPGYDPALDRAIDEREAAELMGVAFRTAQDLRQRGTGPLYMRVSNGRRGRIVYTPRAVILWRQSRLMRSTSESSPPRPERPRRER